MNIVIGLLTVILVVVCLLMVLIVMMQRPKQEGLGAAFGGGMTDQMFGAQTTNVLQKGTVYLAVLFFGITMLLSVLVARQQNKKAALGTNLGDGKDATTTESVTDAGAGAQLLSETPLIPAETGETTTPPATTEGDASTPEGGTSTETPGELEATPSEPTPTKIDDAAPLPDADETPATTETPEGESTDADADAGAETPATEEAPAENTAAAGDTPNL